jgi:hypothetical protein
MNPLTFGEVCEKLQRYDEISLMELLGISSEDLIGAFADRIEEKLEILNKEVDDE